MVLCNTAAKILDPTLLSRRSQIIRQRGLAGIAENVLDRWFTEAYRTSHPQVVNAARKMLLGTSPAGYAHTSTAICSLDLRAGLPSIPCSTLVIGGRHDRATPWEWNAEIASSIPAAQFTTLDAAHLSNMEASAAFNQVVIEFLG
jgi:3-oxoadipate enol-lactonase